ncbi:MAG TPA: hypothetical protein VK492_09445 [Chitinophagaceae bacterium]|nr:hypothetical protein [Chitinophagaceae bacterium]
MPTIFKHTVQLIQLPIQNKPKAQFVQEVKDVPYLLYEVEQLSDGKKIVINKPGGKRNFGKIAQGDLLVMLYDPNNDEITLYRHIDLYNDIRSKLDDDSDLGIALVDALEEVGNGTDPNDILNRKAFQPQEGLSVELLLKIYKWIWVQEDINYPNGEGRLRSLNPLLELRKEYK